MIRQRLIPFLMLIFSILPSSCEQLQELGLTNEEIVGGLKEALNLGAQSAGARLGVTDGYFTDQAVKILLPADAKAMIEKAYLIPDGLGPVAEAILKPYMASVIEKMNRGAEKAASKAAPIFANAITSMSFSDAMNILKGDDTAATGYLRTTTYSPLKTEFAPEIDSAMNEVGAASAWNTLFTTYNSYLDLTDQETRTTLGLETINPNLGEYATEKALNGLFLKLAEEEKLIRTDPIKRTTDLLKKVFKEQD